MVRFIKSAAVVAIVACAGTTGSAQVANGQQPSSSQGVAGKVSYRVSSPEQLQGTVKGLTGPSIITLAPGRYGGLLLRGLAKGPVELRSEDPSNPATFSSVTVRQSADVTLRDLAFTRYQPDTGAGGYLLWVMDSERFTGDGLRFHGYDNKVDKAVSSAVMLRKSRDLVFQKSRFQFFTHGLSFLNVENAKLRFNEFSDMQTDAIRGGGVNGIVIENNVVTDFFPATGDHPDGIQLWSTQQTEPGRNIIIRDNLVVKGRGGYVQGIFVRDTFEKLPFENIEIANNLVVGTMFNGIALLGAASGRISDNEVWSDPAQRSWIRLNRAANVVVEGNRAERFLIVENFGGIEQRANKVGTRRYSNFGPGIREWVASRPSFQEYQGPVLRRLMAD